MSSAHRTGTMESNHFGPEEILARGDAVRDVDDLVAFVVDDRVGPPFTVVQSFLLDLKPPAPNSSIGPRIRDLLEVSHDRSLWVLVSPIRCLSDSAVLPCGRHP